jgi:hypothetical protein
MIAAAFSFISNGGMKLPGGGKRISLNRTLILRAPAGLLGRHVAGLQVTNYAGLTGHDDVNYGASLLRSGNPTEGIQIVEKPLTRADLESSDEVFITSTTRNLLPVLQIEDRKVGRSDGVRQALQQAFSEYVRRYIAEHREVRA